MRRHIASIECKTSSNPFEERWMTVPSVTSLSTSRSTCVIIKMNFNQLFPTRITTGCWFKRRSNDFVLFTGYVFELTSQLERTSDRYFDLSMDIGVNGRYKREKMCSSSMCLFSQQVRCLIAWQSHFSLLRAINIDCPLFLQIVYSAMGQRWT